MSHKNLPKCDIAHKIENRAKIIDYYVERGDMDVIKIIVRNLRDRKDHPLMDVFFYFACVKGKREIIRYLLKGPWIPSGYCWKVAQYCEHLMGYGLLEFIRSKLCPPVYPGDDRPIMLPMSIGGLWDDENTARIRSEFAKYFSNMYHIPMDD